MGLFKQEQVFKPNLATDAEAIMPDIYAFYASQCKDEVIDRIKDKALRDIQIQQEKEEKQKKENLEKERQKAEYERQQE